MLWRAEARFDLPFRIDPARPTNDFYHGQIFDSERGIEVASLQGLLGPCLLYFAILQRSAAIYLSRVLLAARPPGGEWKVVESIKRKSLQCLMIRGYFQVTAPIQLFRRQSAIRLWWHIKTTEGKLKPLSPAASSNYLAETAPGENSASYFIAIIHLESVTLIYSSHNKET